MNTSKSEYRIVETQKGITVQYKVNTTEVRFTRHWLVFKKRELIESEFWHTMVDYKKPMPHSEYALKQRYEPLYFDSLEAAQNYITKFEEDRYKYPRYHYITFENTKRDEKTAV